jgi:hypothetical protein
MVKRALKRVTPIVAAISVTLITAKTKKTRDASLKFLIPAAGFFLATLFSIPAPADEGSGD